MLQRVLAIGVALLVSAGGVAQGQEGGEDGESVPIGVSEVASGLTFPTSMSVTETGDILVAQKLGKVRLVRDGEVVEDPLAEFRVYPQNEGGLVGIEAMPDYAESGEFLAFYTPKSNLQKIYLSKLKLEGETAIVTDEKFLTFPSRNTDRHFGGGLDFGPDGDLYVGLGELRQANRSQNTDNLSGSVLRYNADGTIPEENPLGSDSAIFAFGFRNGFGVHIDSEGTVWQSENGGDVADELNRVEKGKNYGWPEIQGYCDHFPEWEPCRQQESYVAPAYEFRNVIGPTGLLRYESDRIPQLNGDMLITGWHSQWVHRFDVKDDKRLEPMPPLFKLGERDKGKARDSSSLVDVAQGSDGSILLLESGRQVGRILKISPIEQETTSQGLEPVTGENGAQPPASASSGDEMATPEGGVDRNGPNAGCSVGGGLPAKGVPAAGLMLLAIVGIRRR